MRKSTFKDLTGFQSGRWTVLGFSGKKHGNLYWLCRCSCGTEKEVKGGNINKKKTLSCGCLSEDLASVRNSTHKQSSTPIYNVWNSMVMRCHNPNVERFLDYGGRGIKVCDRWRKFENFISDMGERPKGMTIERRDNDGDYEPSNCYWAPWSVQAMHKRNTVYLEHLGEKLCLAEWARRLSLDPKLLYSRKNKGWNDERILGFK